MILRLSAAYFALSLVVLSLGCSRNEPLHDPASTVATDSGSPASHDEHELHKEHAVAAVSALEPGRLWSTDEPLRTAMQRVRHAVEQATANQQGKLSSPDAQALAVTVEENVAFMIANCKLEPNPDAALHVLIGRMMGAAASLKKDPASSDGVPQLRAVLRDYQSTFEHPGWTPLTKP